MKPTGEPTDLVDGLGRDIPYCTVFDPGCNARIIESCAANIEESISDEIDRICQWSNNERRYVVNELLCFALAESVDFQKHKAEQESKSPQTAESVKPAAAAIRAAPESTPITNVPQTSVAARPG